MKVNVETDFHPRLTDWHLRKVLQWINPLDLAGIEYIRLLRGEDAGPNETGQATYLRSPVCVGEYSNPNLKLKNPKAPYITIYTRPFYYGIPWLFRYSPVATLRMAFVLAHEVGHHLIARKGYIFAANETYKPYGMDDEREEGTANRYAVDLVRRMSARWYYRIGHWLSNKISDWYYNFGQAAWEKGEYDEAAYNWFSSHCANPENHDAALAYKRALAKINTRPKSNKRLERTRR